MVSSSSYIFFWIVGLVLAFFIIIGGGMQTTIFPGNPDAKGQFQSNQPGITYTQADIQAGKADILGRYQQVAITSGSMLPLYEIGQFVTLDYDYPFEALKEGDVIAFTPDPEEIQEAYEEGRILDYSANGIMHRIVDVDTNDEGLTVDVETQGDNNDSSIEGVEDNIDKDMYLGKVVEPRSSSMAELTT